jgi:hypothetical protein
MRIAISSSTFKITKVATMGGVGMTLPLSNKPLTLFEVMEAVD